MLCPGFPDCRERKDHAERKKEKKKKKKEREKPRATTVGASGIPGTIRSDGTNKEEINQGETMGRGGEKGVSSRVHVVTELHWETGTQSPGMITA